MLNRKYNIIKDTSVFSKILQIYGKYVNFCDTVQNILKHCCKNSVIKYS